jgi:hypothetical protein
VPGCAAVDRMRSMIKRERVRGGALDSGLCACSRDPQSGSLWHDAQHVKNPRYSRSGNGPMRYHRSKTPRGS